MLVRYDLEQAELQTFKTALLNYRQRFVDDITRHLPQLADVLAELEPRVAALTARANGGERLISLHGRAARRTRGLAEGDWFNLHAWFVGDAGRDSDAADPPENGEARSALQVGLR